jgi:threonine dehydratase
MVAPAGGAAMTAEVEPISSIPLSAIEAARERIAGSVIHTPLIPLNLEDTPAAVYLKLENLQPIGSFKLRGATNAMALAPADALARGVYTCSAGNMAQGVAWNARRLGVPCTVIVPDHAPETKLAAITRLGAEIVKVPFDAWWEVMLTHTYPGLDGVFVHPVSDPAVIAGNGTIGLEILEDLPEVDAVIVPYGGGGLSSGIASAIRPLKPDTKMYACEVETAAPLAPSLAAGSPQVARYTPTFVDGIGSTGLLPEMWPLVRRLLDGSIVVSISDVVRAIKLLVERNRVVAEGAGAASVAAALTGEAATRSVVCVVSGGNIDAGKLGEILAGREPH